MSEADRTMTEHTSEPRDAATSSVLEDVMSGLIEQRLDAPGTYAPRLISNRPGSTMGEAIGEELEHSDSFAMSVAFVRAEAVKTLFESFRACNGDGHRNRIITSTKNYFNDPQAFWELLRLRDKANVDVRVWRGGQVCAAQGMPDGYVNGAADRNSDAASPGYALSDGSRATGTLNSGEPAHGAAVHDSDSIGVSSSGGSGDVAGTGTATNAHTSYGARSNGQPFHPKGYVFARHMDNGRSYYNVYVGSSNLTQSALTSQREWNLRVSSLESGGLVEQVREELDSQLDDSIPLTEEWIRRYEEDFRKYAPPRRQSLREYDSRELTPNAMQQEALANLAALRECGEIRAIIISATGTGKTLLSAFDVRACRPKRMLYLAHRQQILTKAMESYQRVLGCADDDLGLLSGDSRQGDRRYVFATVQTMVRDLAHYAPDAFDYIVVDEAHHSQAESYQRIIRHFAQAGFMLGMTATPERTDGINIFELFDHNIAYEIRLQRALDEDMLCPFHYYGIAEYCGSEIDADGGPARIDVSGGKSASDSGQLTYEIGRLTSPERVRYIIDKIEEYTPYHQQVTGLVFCSRVDEAQRLSDLFNRQVNQREERRYRTEAVSGAMSRRQVEDAVRRLENGELDYIFTVDLFNEGVDIPAVNQIIMLRNTQSSIVFTQQLGRGLRRFPGKDSLIVLDFIGNYANNYLIPVALYGNTGDRDIARRNLQRQTIGLSSISFDPIARDQVLASLDRTNWSEMKRLVEQYRQLRFQLGRVPMLVDVYAHDPSLPMTMASKQGHYLSLVRSCESRRGGKRHDGDTTDPLAESLEPTTQTQDRILKMATELLLPGLRPHELVILDELGRFTDECCTRPGVGADSIASAQASADSPTIAQAAAPTAVAPAVFSVAAATTTPTGTTSADVTLTVDALADAIARRFPQAYQSRQQLESALAVLDFTYFTETNRNRFGGTPLIERTDDGRVRLSPAFAHMLTANRTFRVFFADTLRCGLLNCRDMLRQADIRQRGLDRGFLYEQKYKLADVGRLLGWPHEINGQSVSGYFYHRETGTMPIFVKYAASQYEDRFLSPQELRYFSKNGRTPDSPEFRWMRDGAGTEAWNDTHFIPLFVMRKAEEKESRYYYIGHVNAFGDLTLTSKPDASGEGTTKVTVTNLRLAKPLDGELYRHLTGQPSA